MTDRIYNPEAYLWRWQPVTSLHSVNNLCNKYDGKPAKTTGIVVDYKKTRKGASAGNARSI